MIRLYVGQDLSAAARVVVDGAQCHYLRNVMRRALGDEIALFNGRDGEWRGCITRMDKKVCELAVVAQHSEHLHHLEIDKARLEAFRPISHAVVTLATLVRGDQI